MLPRIRKPLFTLRVFLPFFIIAVVPSACSVNPTDVEEEIQLIMNSDIEEGQYGPAYWTFTTDPHTTNLVYRSGWSTEEFHSSSHSLQIGLNSWEEDPTAYAYWYQFVYPYPDRFVGKEMKLELYYKLKGVEGGGVEILLKALRDVDIVASVRKGPFSGESDWKKVTALLESIPPGTETIIVYLIYGRMTLGNAYFDDITLTVKE